MHAHRVLLLRSGRHLRVAMDALAARTPGCRVAVVGTPGSEAAVEQAGVAPADRFVYPTRFQPLAFFLSLTALRARRWGYDRVAVLWNDPEGTGQGNVNRTALAMSPRGYLAIAPDGSIVERSLWPQLRTECLRVAVSIGVAVAMAVLLYLPGAILSLFRRTSGQTPETNTRELPIPNAQRPGPASPSERWESGTATLGVETKEAA